MPTPDMSDPGAANQDWLNQFLTWLGSGGQGAAPAAPSSMGYPALGGQGQAPNPANMPAANASPMSMVTLNPEGGFNIPPGPAAPTVDANTTFAPSTRVGGGVTFPVPRTAAALTAAPITGPVPRPPPRPVPTAMATGYANQMPFPQGGAPSSAASVPPGYDVGSSGAGSSDPRAQDAAMNQMAGMAPGVVNPGYRPPGITPGRLPPRAVPGSAAAAPAPNLGYYAPTTGIAGRGTWIGPGDPRYVDPAKDPRVYRGPLSMFGRG